MKIQNLGKPLIIGATVGAVAMGLGGYIWKEDHRPPILEIYVFNMKSGRSIFIRTPTDRRILIDGGSNSEVIRSLTDILPFYSRHIDVVVSTNTDGKNVSGLIDVINRYSVDKAYLPAITLESLGLASSTDEIYATLLESLEENNIESHKVIAGDIIPFDPDISTEVIFPVKNSLFKYSKSSAPEIMLQVKFNTTSVTILGDASLKIQKFLATTTSTSQLVRNSGVLVISNSASVDSMSKALLDYLDPKYLVFSKSISNTTPKAKLTSAKTKEKIQIDPMSSIKSENRFNTKEKGTIKIVSDGINIQVSD